MKIKLIFFNLILLQIGFSQQYDSVLFETKNIDENNKIYKIGSVFVYDYEIIYNNKKCKLKTNKGMFSRSEFEFTSFDNEDIDVKRIHLIVNPFEGKKSINKNQTNISYLQEPIYSSISSSGVVENQNNVWIHPIRKGFFNSLETAPFPFVKRPLKINSEWNDQMKIGQGWSNEIWGNWENQLLLNYNYKVIEIETLKTNIGDIECFVIDSSATSKIGVTKLKSYFSEKYGFVRLEYILLNNLKVNMWLIDTKTEINFNDTNTFFKTKDYIKK